MRSVNLPLDEVLAHQALCFSDVYAMQTDHDGHSMHVENEVHRMW